MADTRDASPPGATAPLGPRALVPPPRGPAPDPQPQAIQGI